MPRLSQPGGLRLGTFPVGIETTDFAHMAEETRGNPTIARLAETAPNLVIGVDRLDYSKGLGLKFQAFELMLKNRPEWTDHVTFLQITPKSRSAIPEYAAMEGELDTLSGRINADYNGRADTVFACNSRTVRSRSWMRRMTCVNPSCGTAAPGVPTNDVT